MIRFFKLCAIALTIAMSMQMKALAAGEVFVTDAGAIGGYDAVAYHTESRPVPGDIAITHTWNGATWRFASVANRDAFAKDPPRYAPRYGGYCAYGTAQGYKVSTQPDAFAIVDGVLYLNYNAAVQTMWNKDRPGYISAAERRWDELEHLEYLSDEDSTERAAAKGE